MSELFLVRHAQASFGEEDYDRLSPLGHQQARWLGEYFKFRKLRFDHVICGEMTRHRETLEGICSGMELDTPSQSTHAQWNEFDFEALVTAYLGDHPDEIPAEGAAPSEFTQILHNALQAWADGRITAGIPETWNEFEQRVRSGMSRATSLAASSSKILVVSSGGAISMALRQVLAAPPAAMIQMNLQTRNSSYSHLYFKNDMMQLAGFNHVPHLEHPDRSNAVTYY
jgi:broad specificity phosphatase PhoE